jgi:osmotically inducible protein OsmC
MTVPGRIFARSWRASRHKPEHKTLEDTSMMHPDKILYETEVTATGGRDGKAASADGLLSVSLALPKSLGGPGEGGTNPEQLFAAGYAACFLGAVKLVARTRKITPSAEPTVTAKVGMGPVPVGYALAVELKVLLPGLERSVAEDIVAGAHERCPYSNATRGNIDVKLTVL